MLHGATGSSRCGLAALRHLTLEANSTLARERVSSQYADRLRVISSAEFGDVSPNIRHVEVRCRNLPAGSGKSTAPFK